MAAGIATLDVYEDLNLFNRANDMAPYFEELVHSMKGLPNVVDCRNIGMMGAVELKAMPGAPTKRSSDIFDRCFNKGLLIRATGQTIAMSPPLISEKKDLAQIVSILSEAIHESDKMCK
jgi:beta-alanine--pyruvate transaminase